MGHNEKPHLAGIQEFGAVAYVKDLTAGKLDARAKKGCFVGYDSESKGYRIYWPEKRSISVERNIVFNQEDTNSSEDIAIIHGETSSEGEKDKIIQAPQNKVKDIKSPENKEPEDQTHQGKDPQPHKSLKSTNSIMFPSTDKPLIEPDPQETTDTTTRQYGHGQRVRPEKGHYKNMNEGLVAAIAPFVDKIIDDETFEEDYPYPDNLYELLPDFALAGHSVSDPKMLDGALHGPNTAEWQKALEYEISQLKKLRTWVVEDLPKGQTVIPCSEIARVKQGPNGKI
jgi:hypothetical protein